MSWRIGDIGGTFTDIVLVDEGSGEIGVVKVPPPRDFCQGVLDALLTATGSRGVAPAEVTWLAHATTVVTSALLEGRGGAHGAQHHPGHARRPRDSSVQEEPPTAASGP